MALNDGDKAECKEIAREIVKEVLTEHVTSCPHGLAMKKSKLLVIGVFVGLGFAGVDWVMSVLKVIMELK